MNMTNETNRLSGGLTLQAKLTLAFLFVSLIGFVVAFQLLPRLILRSWNQEFEAAKRPNFELVRSFYSGLGPPLESLTVLADTLIQCDEFDFSDKPIPQEVMDLDEFVDYLTNGEGPAPFSALQAVVEILEKRFKFVRVVPHPVDPLRDRLNVLVNRRETEAYYLPRIVPLVSETEGFHGALAMGGFEPDFKSFDPYRISEDLSGIPLRIASSADIGYFSIEDLADLGETSFDRFGVEEDQEYLVLEALRERKEVVLQLIPLYDLEADPNNEPRVLGFFSIAYKRPFQLFAWTQLLSGEGYSAIAAAAIVALLFSFIFAKGITRPVQTLTASATAFAEGRLDEPVVVRSRDEIGILASTFNEMRQRLQMTLKELQERAETIEVQKEELDEQFKALQILQNYTENVLASVDSAIFSVDTEGRVRSPNRAAQQLLEIDEGCPIEDVLSEGLAERLKSALEMGEATLSEEMTVEAPGGEAVPLAVSVSPLREGENVVGAVAVLTDLSVIKNLEAAVNRQERLAALGQLTAGVAHEIRNPLSIIKACAEILKENFQGQPGENGLCSDIIEEADRLSRVVTEFLTFARPSEPNRNPLNLNELLNRTLDRIELTLPSEVCINREFDPTLPEVEADSDQIEQVLLNLIRNGVEAMSHSGSLNVRTGGPDGGDCVWIEVEDSGEGMDEEARRRAFDPFYTSKAQGTGLGLSICHRILESHGGSIQIRDSKPGVGTIFRMTLPVGDREPVG